jgi:short chain dehydrogenase
MTCSRLRNKTALITAATRNIGRAIAIEFAAEGAHVVASGRSPHRGAELIEEITANGGRAEFVPMDLDGSVQACSALAAEATRLLGGGIDIGVLARPPVLDRQAVGVKIVRDEVGTGPAHVQGVRLGPLGDLLELGCELVLRSGLALLPLASLVPHRPPPAALGSGRVEGDPALQLDDPAAAAGGGAPGPARESLGAERACGLPRPRYRARERA